MKDKGKNKGARSARERDVAVVFSDGHGSPARIGETNVAIEVFEIKPLRDRREEKDLLGCILRGKQTAIADEVSSVAELVIAR